MGYNKSALQILQQAEDLKSKILARHDLLNESQAWTDQHNLQNIYHQALVLDLEYSLDKKIEQDLWNIGFKNHINVLQELVRDKKNPQRSECQALLNWSLESASGFYISLLHEFCNYFDLDLPFRREGKIYGQTKEQILSEQFNSAQFSSYIYICQYCLVHLGDIARYRNQRKQAESFYMQAIQVSSNSGHPYNQLALLEASLGDKLSTVFYYIRGISVKNPFPASTTNLMSTLSSTIDKEGSTEKLQAKMTANEFIHLFLCTHAYLHTLTELEHAKEIVKCLGTIMTALVATESFTSDKLIKMTVINLYALYQVSAINMDELTNDEKKVKSLVLDLLASFLSAFLVPVHTLKSDENLTEYYALPAVKIIFYWIQDHPSILCENMFMRRLQIWPSFCKLLNKIQPFLKDFKYSNYSSLPLSEDRNLKGFLPLSKYLKQFNFKKENDNLNVHKLVRLKRILNFGDWLSEHDVNGTRLITKTEDNGFLKFEPGSIQPDPTNDLLEEIKSFSIDNNRFQTDNKKGVERKGGILKPQGSLEKSREERELLSFSDNSTLDDFNTINSVSVIKPETAKMKRAKQNVALQSIFKKMEENKQVKFNVEERGKDKLTKFEPISVSNPKVPASPSSSRDLQFGSAIRTPQTYNQNHPSVFPPVPPNQQQDYLTTLRNMANNYGMGNNYSMPNMYRGMQGNSGPMPPPAGAGWGGQPMTKTNYSPMDMGPSTFHQLQSSGFDGTATANWWNNQGNNSMMRPGGGGFNSFGPAPFGGGLMGGPKMNGGNQASGDSFNSPWSYGNGRGGANGLDQSLSMRQQMLKETNSIPTSMNEKFLPNHPNNNSGYSLFNTSSWNPSLTNQLRNPVGPPSDNGGFGPLQQSSLFSNQGPQSLAQLLEQQNQMQKIDFH